VVEAGLWTLLPVLEGRLLWVLVLQSEGGMGLAVGQEILRLTESGGFAER